MCSGQVEYLEYISSHVCHCSQRHGQVFEKGHLERLKGHLKSCCVSACFLPSTDFITSSNLRKLIQCSFLSFIFIS